jgi:hypothetical protein
LAHPPSFNLRFPRLDRGAQGKLEGDFDRFCMLGGLRRIQRTGRKRDNAGMYLTWVRGGEADGRNFANISMVYAGQILGVCLTHGSCRRRLLDRENPLRH